MEILHVEMDLRRLRSSLGDLEERQKHRQQIEVLRGELDASNSYLVALKYELSKTQVSKFFLPCMKSRQLLKFLR